MKLVLILAILLCLALAEDPHVGINWGWSTRTNDVDGRIFGGHNALAGEHPYQVSYQSDAGLGRFAHLCGGSIVSPTFVVTAGHCILSEKVKQRVVVGILNLNDIGVNRQNIDVIQRIVHPEYKTMVGPHDIAVLKLASAITFNSAVQPIRLPKSGAVPTGSAVLSGWGLTPSIPRPVMPTRLQTLNVPIVPILQCRVALDDYLKKFNGTNPLDNKANVCTGPLSGGFSACSGDSGGPLAQNGTLLGVVSWGMVPCGSKGAPSVFTKVENYLNFIKSNVPDLPARF